MYMFWYFLYIQEKMSNIFYKLFNVLSANPTKWSNTLKQFVGNLPTVSLNVFDHFVGLALNELNSVYLFHFLELQTKIVLNCFIKARIGNK